MPVLTRFFTRYRIPVLLLTLAFIAVLTALAPIEKTLGSRVRLIYFHGAWVWAGKAAFGLASLAGLAALLLPTRLQWARWSRASLAVGRAGLVFWLTYLPVSLLVQQLNWGGIFWDEPLWRVPAAFGVAAVLLQAALWLFNHPLLSAVTNLAFGVALWVGLGNAENVLHPESPIFGSGSTRIELFFVLLTLLSLACMAQVAAWFHEAAKHPA